MTTIKINRKYEVTLNGNTISGDTFPVKDYIKSYLSGKWDSVRKVWIVDEAKVNGLISKGAIAVVNSPAAPKAERVHGVNGWCDKCHSYCYGDCESH